MCSSVDANGTLLPDNGRSSKSCKNKLFLPISAVFQNSVQIYPCTDLKQKSSDMNKCGEGSTDMTRFVNHFRKTSKAEPKAIHKRVKKLKRHKKE
jgi:hypothetical protein